MARDLESPVCRRSIRRVFEAGCERAKLADVTFHTLRHTFASRLAMRGESSRTIQDLGGWATLALVERYAHLSPGHKARAVEGIALENFENGAEFPDVKPTLAPVEVAAEG